MTHEVLVTGPLPVLAVDVAGDARVSETPLVDKDFASVRKIGNRLYATISDLSKGNTTVCNGGFLVGRDAADGVDPDAARPQFLRERARDRVNRALRSGINNPGLVITEGVTTAGFDQSDFRKTLESQTPLGRIGQTEDIAPAVVFFASSDSKWITGETLLIAGGLR
jgi:Enoyl-(Acyl carrier protein) reductase